MHNTSNFFQASLVRGTRLRASVRVFFPLISWSSASNNSFTLSACFILCTEQGKPNKSQHNDFPIHRLPRRTTRLFASKPPYRRLLVRVCLLISCTLEVGPVGALATAAFILTSSSTEHRALAKSGGDEPTDHK